MYVPVPDTKFRVIPFPPSHAHVALEYLLLEMGDRGYCILECRCRCCGEKTGKMRYRQVSPPILRKKKEKANTLGGLCLPSCTSSRGGSVNNF
ncbi:hypothetical protein ABEF92_001827 [Exophiala dermatitidis]|uniref:Uncharacterized protein n=1 Tax=Exophiala dermatitidis (strain ATCC 34100 / CBS 525.76 / NIH/UT8656) TaxID=858893 RepID=H6C947_EXODN|nr:uncharacterized protein HMPREF1120_08577 [Exophiala dermatitidis NIH/UT8656]EHY60624.1 hypothetical protein HMPREF1120_08577 [Exophiala dermatitidis NIH/UT8656]